MRGDDFELENGEMLAETLVRTMSERVEIARVRVAIHPEVPSMVDVPSSGSNVSRRFFAAQWSLWITIGWSYGSVERMKSAMACC